MNKNATILHPYGSGIKPTIERLLKVPELSCLPVEGFKLGKGSVFWIWAGWLCGDVRVFWQLSGWYCSLTTKGRSRVTDKGNS